LALNLSAYAEIKKEYYPNGDVKREIQYSNGKKNGTSKFYLEGNHLLATANYKMGVREGSYTEYDNKGNITLKDTFADGEKIDSTHYYKDGKPLDGVYKTQNPKGEDIVTTYKQGIKLGLQMKCNNDDECIKQVIKEGGHISYSLLYQGTVTEKRHYKDNILEGELLTYGYNGRITRKSLYKNGEKEGLQTTYYPNGKLHTKTTFHKGLVKIDTTTFNEDGSIEPRTNPYNGIYTYDTSKIKNAHILRDIERSKSLGSDPFQLTIDESIASIFGYQTGQPIRQRWYTPCILKNGDLELINATSHHNKNYCSKPQKKHLVLKFKKGNKSQRRLICENCEEHGFPSTWFR